MTSLAARHTPAQFRTVANQLKAIGMRIVWLRLYNESDRYRVSNVDGTHYADVDDIHNAVSAGFAIAVADAKDHPHAA